MVCLDKVKSTKSAVWRGYLDASRILSCRPAKTHKCLNTAVRWGLSGINYWEARSVNQCLVHMMSKIINTPLCLNCVEIWDDCQDVSGRFVSLGMINEHEEVNWRLGSVFNATSLFVHVNAKALSIQTVTYPNSDRRNLYSDSLNVSKIIHSLGLCTQKNYSLLELN